MPRKKKIQAEQEQKKPAQKKKGYMILLWQIKIDKSGDLCYN